MNNFTNYGIHKKIKEYNSNIMKLLPIIKKNKKYIIDNKRLHKYPLRDFYIFSSHNTYITNKQNMDTNSLKMIENALKLNVREIELDVYAKNWLGKEIDNDHEPIVTHGLVRGIGESDIFLNSNLLPLEKCFDTIKKYMNYNNNTDPLIINIELNTHHIKFTNNQIIDLSEKYFKDKLYLPKNNDRYILEDTPIGELINKVILVIHKLDNDILSKYSSDYCNIPSSDDKNINLNYTKNKLVRVYPKGDIKSHFSHNIDPIKYWNNGIQMVACNIQKIDENLKEHFKKFKYYSFVLKPRIFRK